MKEFNIDNILVVDIEEVRPNSWNPKNKDTWEYKKILKSIKKDGLKAPVIVRENNGFEIIDGEQRYTALKELGRKKIVINNQGVVDDIEAKNETLWWQLQVPFDNTLLSPLIAELQIADVELPFADDTIEELLNLADFDLENMLKEQIENNEVRTLSVKLGKEAYEIIMQAIEKVKSEVDGCTEARALELICADYLGK